MKETKQRYAEIPNCEFIQAAVVDFDSDKVEIFLPAEEVIQKSAHASLNKDHVIKHLHPNVRSVMVPTIRINELLEKFDGPIDRVYIDTEGLDARIIQDIDFTRFVIPRLQFEVTHTDGPHRTGFNFQMLVTKLQRLGYQLQRCGEYDVVGVLPNNKVEGGEE
jgi:hypothetical protein